jgi:hypothetical protein
VTRTEQELDGIIRRGLVAYDDERREAGRSTLRSALGGFPLAEISAAIRQVYAEHMAAGPLTAQEVARYIKDNGGIMRDGEYAKIGTRLVPPHTMVMAFIDLAVDAQRAGDQEAHDEWMSRAVRDVQRAEARGLYDE